MTNTENKNKNNSRFSNKGGRPAVSKGLARTETMSTRMTVAEKMITVNKAKTAGKAPSVYMREASLYGEVKPARTKEDRQQIRMIEGGINNLNQLTRLAHLEGVREIVPELLDLKAELVATLNHIIGNYDVRH